MTKEVLYNMVHSPKFLINLDESSSSGSAIDSEDEYDFSKKDSDIKMTSTNINASLPPLQLDKVATNFEARAQAESSCFDDEINSAKVKTRHGSNETKIETNIAQNG